MSSLLIKRKGRLDAHPRRDVVNRPQGVVDTEGTRFIEIIVPAEWPVF